MFIVCYNVQTNNTNTMGKTKEFVAEVETHLYNIYKAIGIDRPENHEDILDFVVNDVIETADPENWHSGDVAIAFRRWIEQGDATRNEVYQEVIDMLDEVKRKSNNCDKNQVLVDAVIEELKKDFSNGDYTVIEEILFNVPKNILLHSLPEERWKEFQNINNNPNRIWLEIHNDFEYGGFIHIDAWTTADEMEDGKTIAKINVLTKEVIYLDERASTDEFAQEVIQERLKSL